MTYTDPYVPRTVRLRSVVLGVLVAALAVLGYLYPYRYAKDRLAAAATVWQYLNAPVQVDLGDGKQSNPIVRREFIDGALVQAVKQAAAQTAPAPAGAKK